MARLTSDFWKKHLDLQHHIEGGWYHEVYRSGLTFNSTQLPGGYNGDRSACTHIYFLLEKNEFSAFHRIRSDEMWHFYAGDPLVVYEIDQNGDLTEHHLGNDPSSKPGQSLFCVIKAGSWFASEVISNGEYSLVGCTVAPGFDFNDFELANKEQLLSQFPSYSTLINRLSK